MSGFRRAPQALAGAAVAGIVCWLLFAMNGAPEIGISLGLAAIAVGIWAFVSAHRQAAGFLQASCSARSAAIHYSGWHGTFHTFVFANRAYLDAFMKANERKTMSDVRVL